MTTERSRRPSSRYEPHDDPLRVMLIGAAAEILEARSYDAVTLQNIASKAGVDVSLVISEFSSMHELGSAILDAESATMHTAQRTAAGESDDPSVVLARTLQLVGESIASSPVVRAGMRLAVESRHHFPERKIDPYRTWHGFVSGQLDRAQERGQIRNDIDIDALTWLLVTAGMGTKDLLAFRNSWEETPSRLTAIVDLLLHLTRP